MSPHFKMMYSILACLAAVLPSVVEAAVIGTVAVKESTDIPGVPPNFAIAKVDRPRSSLKFEVNDDGTFTLMHDGPDQGLYLPGKGEFTLETVERGENFRARYVSEHGSAGTCSV
jgi:hypothetical protein